MAIKLLFYLRRILLQYLTDAATPLCQTRLKYQAKSSAALITEIIS